MTPFRQCALAILLIALAPGTAPAQSQRNTPPAAAALTPDSQAFCTSIRDPATEARFAWQARTLKTLEQKLTETLAKLDEKKAELQAMMDQRDAEAKQAEARMVDIFSRMRPDAAALQLAAMDHAIAASLLGKLAPRNASAVLNEMEAARAAQLTETMGGRRPRAANALSPRGATATGALSQ